MKLGVITDCFRLPLNESLSLASRLGFQGVQIYATSGEFCPSVMKGKQMDAFQATLADIGLEISALCGDMGGSGFQNENDNPERIRKTKEIIDLASEVGAHVVTTHIGVIPADRDHPRYRVMLNALTECGRYAMTKNVTLAIETGPETAAILLSFVEDTEGGVGVNLDPANFVMVTGQDPVEAVKLLGKHIVHTHAKDGIMLRKTDPEIIYGHFATGGIRALNVADYFLETPIGEGKVDFKEYLNALKSIGYNGYLTLERETGANPIADIEKAIRTLKQFDI